ncbi:MarR family transcriptional regulator [Alcanivorax xiamenensis]|uniref:MarR family transcriptional regulator n=2 Tax=Alcanivoracaceae TaxID=224372 RepID=A0A9Q3W5P2_9GAMM|nr:MULTISPECIES: MarR family transcriptional regulator [Alcanivoracaceae]KAF0807794.1 MarR family transcriptional regulator [Alcanivorax xiamenensis]MCE7509469.1 MarR family transcriptional regulator [Alloalcanivorax xenomutans]
MDVLNELSQALDGVLIRLRRELRDGLRREGIRLPPPAVQVLLLLQRRGAMGMRDVAACSGRDKGQLTRLVTALVEEGLVERQVNDLDRRAARVSLTAKGLSTASLCARIERRALHHLCEPLSASDQASLTRLLRRCLQEDEG